MKEKHTLYYRFAGNNWTAVNGTQTAIEKLCEYIDVFHFNSMQTKEGMQMSFPDIDLDSIEIHPIK